MMKSVPPLNDLFNMAGLNLPTYLKGTEPTKEITSAEPDKKKRFLEVETKNRWLVN
jgi:flotillin